MVGYRNFWDVIDDRSRAVPAASVVDLGLLPIGIRHKFPGGK
jgi:hypothetical protein